MDNLLDVCFAYRLSYLIYNVGFFKKKKDVTQIN